VLGVGVAGLACLVVFFMQGGSLPIAETDELYVASTTGAYAPHSLAGVNRYCDVLWSPDSSEMLVRDMMGRATIWGVDGHERRVTSMPEWGSALGWSPDGEMIVN